jgi:hypothetical protein
MHAAGAPEYETFYQTPEIQDVQLAWWEVNLPAQQRSTLWEAGKPDYQNSG